MIATAKDAVIEQEPIVVAMPHTEPWYAARSTGFGASESAAACGWSKYRTALEVYCHKLGLIPDLEDNDYLWFGRELEPIVVKKFCLETGMQVAQYPCPMLRHPVHSFILATTDAVLTNEELLECKTTSSFNYRKHYGDEETDDTPVDINFQGQQQLSVTGREICHVATLVDGRKIRKHRIVRDESMISAMIPKLSELWSRIQNREPPDADYQHPSTLDLMKDLYQEKSLGTVILPASLAEVRRDRDRIAEKIKELESAKDAKDAELRHAIGNAQVALFESAQDEHGVPKPCEFELTRSLVAETTYTTTRKSYFVIRKRKAKA